MLAAASLLLPLIAAGCGSSSYARRESGDRQLSARVDGRLASTPELSSVKLAAKSHSGVIALLGEVPEEALRLQAERVASTVPGVVRVNNLILVVKSASKSEGSSPVQGALFISRAD
ncbi:MAG: BON domain-containing protein [Acidobacteriota bacterium]|nr:BON domain-containing protein [Acidobacteriota bacterium]